MLTSLLSFAKVMTTHPPEVTDLTNVTGFEDIHFQVKCTRCDTSLLARTGNLKELVDIVLKHFERKDPSFRKRHETIPATPEQVLRHDGLAWSIFGASPYLEILSHTKAAVPGFVDPVKIPILEPELVH